MSLCIANYPQPEYTSLSVGIALIRGKGVSVAQWNELVFTLDLYLKTQVTKSAKPAFILKLT
ncbi:hypothetical protein NCCP28_23450 [Niallia sp. NCCP-28]|nr:hypothetical protein NCCP28_23450 [Niallia sp. NCCP-28]